MSNDDKIKSIGRLVTEYKDTKEEFTVLRADLSFYLLASGDLLSRIGDHSPLEYEKIIPEAQKLVDFGNLQKILAEISELAKKLEGMHANMKTLGIDIDTAFMSPLLKAGK
jgi:hypothetical protein